MKRSETIIIQEKALTVNDVLDNCEVSKRHQILTNIIKRKQLERAKYNQIVDPTGRKIIDHLITYDRLNQTELRVRSRIPQTILSQRLGKMIEAGIVEKEKVGKFSFFSLTDKAKKQ